MTRPFSDLLPDLLGGRGLVNVPPSIAEMHLRRATIELCERTHIWVATVYIDAQAGVADYPLDVPDGAAVVQVRSVKIGNCCLTPDRSGVCTGCGCHKFRVEGNHTLWIPTPNSDADQSVQVEVVCKPKQDSCGLPDELYEDWAETILDGAAYRCFSMPKTEWYSTGMTTFYVKSFNVGIARAKNKLSLGRVSGPLMIRGARF